MGEARAIGKVAAARTGSRQMSSPVNWALLGLVIERPSYGYELGQRFERVYGDLLPLSCIGHVYKALDALKARSLIEELPATVALQMDVRRQGRGNFRATAEGVRSYREHLAAELGEDHRRSMLFVRKLAMLCRAPDAGLDLLDQYEQASLAETVQTPIPSADGIDRLALEEGRLKAQGKLAWVKLARREFAAFAGREGSIEPS